MNFDSLNSDKIEYDENFKLSEHTTYGLGGKCKKAYFPKTTDEAILIFNQLKSKNEKFFVLGNGSNILASDSFYNGSVVCTSRLKKIEREGEEIICQSGVTVAELLSFCVNFGVSGLEFLAGIPASVGGLTYMNAGAGDKYISDVLINCCVFDDNLRNFSNKLCKFGYKHSTMRNIDCIILTSKFKIEQSSPENVRINIRKYLLKRADQPKGRSCGCIFKNPPFLSAGKLIDDCGLKGFRIGGAAVSDKHANFILNDGASASDVYNLISYVKWKVWENSGICLEEEVVYIGEFDDTLS